MSKEKVPRILEERLGRRHAHQRLGVESDHEAQVFGQSINFFHIENMPLGQTVYRHPIPDLYCILATPKFSLPKLAPGEPLEALEESWSAGGR